MTSTCHDADQLDCRDFPKALWACTILEILVFSVVGAIIYAYTGNQYMTAPAFGSLQDVYKKVSFSFMIPTLIFLGCLYASVSARFVFFRIFQNSRHKNDHTLIGWVTWAGILRESTRDCARHVIFANIDCQWPLGLLPSSSPRLFRSSRTVSHTTLPWSKKKSWLTGQPSLVPNVVPFR